MLASSMEACGLRDEPGSSDDDEELSGGGGNYPRSPRSSAGAFRSSLPRDYSPVGSGAWMDHARYTARHTHSGLIL